MKRKTTKSKPAPVVGIIYLVGKKLLIDSTPLDQAGEYAHFKIHEGDHITYWANLVKTGAVPKEPYEKNPHGRVAYNTTDDQFMLLADPCILRRKAIVKAILLRMNIPLKSTVIGPDSHYKCFECLRQNR